jgi:hypothetical protein
MSHIYEHRNYIIFPVSQLNLIDFSQVLETSADTVRKSVNGSKTFVKWDGETAPACISLLSNTEGPYNHSEILDILSTNEWSAPLSGSGA